MTLSTALQIFTNPGDLHFELGIPFPPRTYVVHICRGPGHNYIPLLSGDTGTEDKEQALDKVADTLKSICFAATVAYSGGSQIVEILNPGAEPIDESSVLNEDLVARIVAELREKGRCSTHEMLAVA